MAPDRYKFSGVIKQTSALEIEITELPIRVWTQDYKNKIVDIIKAEKVPSFIKDYDDYNTHNDVHFVIRMEEKHMTSALEEGLEEKFKLTKSIATSNLVAFDEQGRITKYATVEDIMKEFYGIRIKFYQKRKVSYTLVVAMAIYLLTFTGKSPHGDDTRPRKVDQSGTLHHDDH